VLDSGPKAAKGFRLQRSWKTPGEPGDAERQAAGVEGVRQVLADRGRSVGD
jgi:hypothetical protein